MMYIRMTHFHSLPTPAGFLLRPGLHVMFYSASTELRVTVGQRVELSTERILQAAAATHERNHCPCLIVFSN